MSYHVMESNNTRNNSLLQLNLAVGISASVCLLVCVCVLSLLLLYRTHKTFLQRSLVYFSLAVLVQTATQAGQLSQYRLIRDGQLNATSCAVLGFATNYMNFVILHFFLVFMLTLLVKTYHANRRAVLLDHRLSCCPPLATQEYCVCVCVRATCFKSCRVVMEAGIVLFCVAFPALEALPPLVTSRGYGLFWGACWIRDSATVITNYRYIYSYVPLGLVFLTSLGMALVLAPLYCYHAIHNRQYPHYLLLLKRSLALISVLAFVQLLGVFLWYIVATKHNETLLKVGGALLPAYFIFQVLAFLKYLFPFKMLGCVEMNKAARKWKSLLYGHGQVEDREFTAFNSSSHSKEVPSNTYFSVKFTGQFTSA